MFSEASAIYCRVTSPTSLCMSQSQKLSIFMAYSSNLNIRSGWSKKQAQSLIAAVTSFKTTFKLLSRALTTFLKSLRAYSRSYLTDYTYSSLRVCLEMLKVLQICSLIHLQISDSARYILNYYFRKLARFISKMTIILLNLISKSSYMLKQASSVLRQSINSSFNCNIAELYSLQYVRYASADSIFVLSSIGIVLAQTRNTLAKPSPRFQVAACKLNEAYWQCSSKMTIISISQAVLGDGLSARSVFLGKWMVSRLWSRFFSVSKSICPTNCLRCQSSLFLIELFLIWDLQRSSLKWEF